MRLLYALPPSKEAQRLARLRHPALPNVIDHFTEQGGQYLVMEFIEGQDLAQLLEQRQQPFPVPEVVRWAERLLDALDYLHQKKVIHRDIKPANIKLTPEGELILLDFGLAKGGLTRHTLSGMSLKGYTPGYAPPEQVTGQATDERSDLYSLAATLYALLTKQAPQVPSVREQVMAHHVPDPLRPANELNPHVSPQLAHTLARALALEPHKRFATAAQMRSQLVFPPKPPVMPTPVSTDERTTRRTGNTARGQRAPSQNPPPRKPPAQLPTWAIAAGGVFVLLVGILLGTMFINRDSGSSTPSESSPIVNANTPVPPTPEAGQPIISEKHEMTLLYVPEGDFEMGAADNDSDASSDEKPRHTVFLEAYWIDETEVTNEMYRACVEAGVCGAPASNESYSRESYYDNAEYNNYPVIYVSWNDATAYCQWAGRRLPTEACCTKAARGTDGRKYPWGDEAPTDGLANFNSNVGDTTEVGSYSNRASPYGALDMAGNVWEWVNDWYDADYYATSPRNSPAPAAISAWRIRCPAWRFVV